MGSWNSLYKGKLITTEEAALNIKSGDDVIVAQCASEPPGLHGAISYCKEQG